MAIVLFVSGVIPSKEPVDPEAYCPVGGMQALTTFFVNGSLPCSMSSLQIMMGIMLAAAVVLFSKLFCGYVCPLGTVQDLLVKLRKFLGFKGVSIPDGSVADYILRLFKYLLLFWIFYMTATASELFCKNLDPYYAVATGFKGEITLWMSLTTLFLLILGGLFVNMFWCKYFCPLGAISNTLKFWVWIVILFALYYLLNVVGLTVPWWIMLGAFCLAGYLLEVFNRKPRYQIVNVIKDADACTRCGLCNRNCPYGVNVKDASGGKLSSVDCTLCGECTAVCPENALRTGVCSSSCRSAVSDSSSCKSRGKCSGRYIPALLTVLLAVAGIWAGNRFELPTIDEVWGLEVAGEDGGMVSEVDRSALSTLRIDGLRSVKCYGSSIALKAKLQKVTSIYGVKTYVNHHYAVITYDPAVITPEKIQEAIYVPSKNKLSNPDLSSTDSLAVYTIRAEKMYDRLDINYLGMLISNTGRKVYGLATEFACPLIIRVYADASENLDEQWFRNVVESESVTVPQYDGSTIDIELEYEFAGLEGETDRISALDFIKVMFAPYRAEIKGRVEEYAGKDQYIYEIADQAYDNPSVPGSMPYLSSHLSKHEGFIGLYLELNQELVPCIRVRYVDPMTEDDLWKLLTMKEWSVTFSGGEVSDIPARITFRNKGRTLFSQD